MSKRFEDNIGTIYYQGANGARHREDGPAIITMEGHQYWYLNDKPHRADGPAFLEVGGPPKWYIEGRYLNLGEILIAQQILSGELLHKIPLYINDPILKYFCQVFLERGPTTVKMFTTNN